MSVKVTIVQTCDVVGCESTRELKATYIHKDTIEYEGQNLGGWRLAGVKNMCVSCLRRTFGY